jgi:serine/threonine protein phosphatase 1
METYVMGDLHGNWRALRQCLERCAFDYENDILIQLGDVVDGKNEVYECVQELLRIRHLISIKGNHDAWLTEFLMTGYHPVRWAFGGISTVKSYLMHAGKKQVIIPAGNGFKVPLNPEDIPLEHHKFFHDQLPFYVDKDNNCFVHGGFDRFQPFKNQRTETYYWDRTLWLDALTWQIEKHYYGTEGDFFSVTQFHNIFIGHKSTTEWGIDVPLKAANIYNLDTGAGNNGRLTIMDVQSKSFWQSDKVLLL